MSPELFVITTGISIGLMDRFDTLRASGLQLIGAFDFPTDIEMSLRQNFNSYVDSTIAAAAANGTVPEPLITPAGNVTPAFTFSNAPVFTLDEPEPVSQPVPAA